MMAASPWLSDDEVRELCEPLVQPAAMRRFLAEQLRLHVRSKKNGRPLVTRSELERVLGATRFGPDATPSQSSGVDIQSLRKHLAERKAHATQQTRR